MDFVYKLWIHFKLLYLYLLYWFVGLTPEDYYTSKANYLADLGHYNSAIKFYEIALSDSKDPRIYAWLGWCYLELDNNVMAVEYYRKAYEKIKNPAVLLGLAFAELNNNNKNISISLFDELQKGEGSLNSTEKIYFEKLKEKLEM